MKSWKQERLRRKQIFISIKLRRQFARDLDTWTRNLIKSQQQVHMFSLLEKNLKKKIDA